MPISFDQAAAQQERVLLVVRIFAVGATLLLVGLLGRVVQLQYRPDRPIADRVVHRGATGRLLARRGALLDTRGRPLAISRLGRRLFVDPQLIEDPAAFPLHVAHAIGASAARIDRMINRRADSRYVVIEPLLNEEQLAAVRRLDLPGLATEPVAVRHYPQEKTAGQVIGFVGTEHKGLDGLEYKLEPVLSGRAGHLETLRDARRRPLWIERAGYTPPSDGKDVRLSIDTVIQRIAERELAAACEKYQADRGEVVVMDARSGQLLAMANWPPMDPRDPTASDVSHRRNRCVTDPYEPGSVFKPFIHAAATEAGLADPKDIIDCTEAGFWVSPVGRFLHDAHGHGKITWSEVLVLSSNIGMAKVCRELGPQRMHRALSEFGFGRLTGVALPGESAGIVNPLDAWTSYSLSSIPMGQEIGTTPVQLVRAFSVFANGGLAVSPTVLAAEADSPIYQRVLRQRTADYERRLLRRVVTKGTGRRAQSDLYRIWGKTGTAQVPDRVHGGYKDNAYTASFICGAPLLEPRIIVLCSVHEPDPDIGYYGGVVSAPVAKRVVERTLTYLGVPPDVQDEEEETAEQDARVAAAG